MDDLRSLPQRTPREEVVDKLLLIYILSNHKIEHDTKAQKTVFFAEDSMDSKGIKGFSYNFFRWHFGEFSKEVESDLKELKTNGFITGNLEVTEEGREILDKTKGLLEANSEITKRIDMFGNYTKNKSLAEVKNVAYTRIFRDGVAVRDIPLGKIILIKMDESKAKMEFKIDEGWLGTLEVLFNKKLKQSLEIAIGEKEYIPFQV